MKMMLHFMQRSVVKRPFQAFSARNFRKQRVTGDSSAEGLEAMPTVR